MAASKLSSLIAGLAMRGGHLTGLEGQNVRTGLVAHQDRNATCDGVCGRQHHIVGRVAIPAGRRPTTVADQCRDSRFTVAEIGRNRCVRVPQDMRRDLGGKLRSVGNPLPELEEARPSRRHLGWQETPAGC
jgi:hypothetical protein